MAMFALLLLPVDDLKMEMNKSENELAKVRKEFAVTEAEALGEMKLAKEALRECREMDKEWEKDNDWMKQQTERAEKAVRESQQIEETMREMLEKMEAKDPDQQGCDRQNTKTVPAFNRIVGSTKAFSHSVDHIPQRNRKERIAMFQIHGFNTPAYPSISSTPHIFPILIKNRSFIFSNVPWTNPRVYEIHDQF
uniref:Tropomyosin n=1 Tax=Globodera rostochiensis TaxID=31243 RepID=A0A914HMR2_GLORO